MDARIADDHSDALSVETRIANEKVGHMAGDAQTSGRSKTRMALAAIAISLGAVGTIGWRWYSYVTAGESPYDEVGIELNGHAPSPLRAWGCARIADRFPGSVPPYGC